MPIAAPLVLRLDLGYRFHHGNVDPTGCPHATAARFADFFFGFNY
jgi:hypothetical protein